MAIIARGLGRSTRVVLGDAPLRGPRVPPGTAAYRPLQWATGIKLCAWRFGTSFRVPVPGEQALTHADPRSLRDQSGLGGRCDTGATGRGLRQCRANAAGSDGV